MRVVSPPSPFLYARVMGQSWETLAEPVRRAHQTREEVRAQGYMRIEHGRNLVARALIVLLRLPRASDGAPARLVVTPRDGREEWRRTLNGRSLRTEQYQRTVHTLAERYGLLEFRFRLAARDGALVYRQREASLLFGPLRLPIPSLLAPQIDARETAAPASGIDFSVRVDLPWFGLLMAYSGTIFVEDARA
jgi:hypothetical protein